MARYRAKVNPTTKYQQTVDAEITMNRAPTESGGS